MKYKVVNLDNKEVDEIEINNSIYQTKIFPDIIHNYIRYQMAKNRQGSHKTKGRSEVKGRSKKPFSQKGTGNARQGSSKGPHFRGGGISFGPVVRDHSIKLNKRERKLALRCAFSEKIKNNELKILDNIKLDSHKTKNLNDKIKKLKVKSIVFVHKKDEIDKNFLMASSNIANVNLITTDGLNIKDMFSCELLYVFKSALKGIEERLL